MRSGIEGVPQEEERSGSEETETVTFMPKPSRVPERQRSSRYVDRTPPLPETQREKAPSVEEISGENTVSLAMFAVFPKR